jgi:hypothetical protein
MITNGGISKEIESTGCGDTLTHTSTSPHRIYPFSLSVSVEGSCREVGCDPEKVIIFVSVECVNAPASWRARTLGESQFPETLNGRSGSRTRGEMQGAERSDPPSHCKCSAANPYRLDSSDPFSVFQRTAGQRTVPRPPCMRGTAQPLAEARTPTPNSFSSGAAQFPAKVASKGALAVGHG